MKMQKKIDAILTNINREPLSSSLGKTLRLAERAGATEIAKWCRLELGGYDAFNTAKTDDVVVPEYRAMAGQHYDIYGQLFVVPSDLDVINQTRLRHGVAEIESMEPVAIHDAGMCEVIKEHLNVEVYAFQFSRSSLAAVLSNIRTELGDRLEAMRGEAGPEDTAADDDQEEVFQLKPSIYGVSVDLKALWRKLTGSG